MRVRAPLRGVTPAEIAAFERDGFVVLPQVLSPLWLASLEGACERILSMRGTQDITEKARDLDPRAAAALVNRARGHFFLHFNTARRDEAVMDFALGGALGGMAAAVMQATTARFVDDILFVKEPHTDEPTEWHDDDFGGVTYGGQRCSLWVTLADVPEEAGPLRFLRGSHRSQAGWRDRGEDADDIIARSQDDVATCPVRVGDVIAHHPSIIHGTGGNDSETVRRSWAIRFVGEGVRFRLPAIREAERQWYGLEDGAPAVGPRFPVAWPPEDARPHR